MECFLQIWDEIDDAVGFLRHHPAVLALCSCGVLMLAIAPLLLFV